MRWRRGQDGAWRVTEWTALDDLRSRAAAPVFTEVTEAALGRNASFRRQLVPGLDDWSRRSTPSSCRAAWDTTASSVGDSDGDGLDDLYVSQPEGLPNRLFRNKGDGTFEDVTEAAGRRRPRPHVAVALRGRGQRRRPGPDPAHAQRAAAVRQRRQGPLHARRRRVPVRASRLQGVAHLRRHGRLRPRRLPRPLPLRLRLLHRRQRGQGGPALAVPRCAERPAERAAPERRPRAVRGGDRGGGPGPEQRPVQLRRRPGPTTTRTAGPTCWWRTTSAARTSTATRAW